MQFVTAEVDALEQIRHENIVKVLDLCEDDEHICVVMELVTGGNLGMLVRERFIEKDEFTEQEIVSMVYQILLALKYLHERERPLAHRDLKPDNILVEEDPATGMIVCKLTDFGMAFEESKD